MLIKIWHSYLYISITFLTKLNCLFFRIWRYLRENRSWVRLCLHGNQSVSILKGWIFVCEGFWGSETIRNLWIQWCHSNVLLQWFIGLGIRHSKRRNVVRFKNGQFCDLKIAALSSCIILFIKWPKCITLSPFLPTVCYIKEIHYKGRDSSKIASSWLWIIFWEQQRRRHGKMYSNCLLLLLLLPFLSQANFLWWWCVHNNNYYKRSRLICHSHPSAASSASM